MPSLPLHSGSTRTSTPAARASWQYLAGSSAIPKPWRAATIKISKLPLARRGSTGMLLVSPFSAVRCQVPPLCSSWCRTGKLARSDGYRNTRLRKQARARDQDASTDTNLLHLQVGIGVEALANADRNIDPVVNEVDPAIGCDTLNAQLRVSGKESRQGTGDCVLKSERAAQSNKPARLGLHSKRRLLGGLGLDNRRARMFENLLAALGQAEASRRSIEQPHSEPLLQQGDATANA